MPRKRRAVTKVVEIELSPFASDHPIFAHRLGRRYIAVGLRVLGLAAGDIATLLGTDSKRIAAWQRTFDEAGDLADEPRSGRPKSLDEDDLQVVKDALRAARPERAAFLGKVVAELQESGALRSDVTVQTVRRTLYDDGMRYQNVVRLSYLSAEQRARRVAFCRRQLAHNRWEMGYGPTLWAAGAISDSSYFQMNVSLAALKSRRAVAARARASARGPTARAPSMVPRAVARFEPPTTRCAQATQKGPRVKIWQDSETGRRQQPMSQSGGFKVHAYGAVTIHGATKLITEVTGTTGVAPYSYPAKPAGPRGGAAQPAGVHSGVCAEEYRDILGPDSSRHGAGKGHNMLGQVKAIFERAGKRDAWCWQQDGAGAHSLSTVKTQKGYATRLLVQKYAPYFEDEWPGNSADLSIIENVWALVQQEMHMNGTWANSAEFTAALVAAWDKVTGRSTGDLSTLQKLFGGMKARFEECVEREGWHVKAGKIDGGANMG